MTRTLPCSVFGRQLALSFTLVASPRRDEPSRLRHVRVRRGRSGCDHSQRGDAFAPRSVAVRLLGPTAHCGLRLGNQLAWFQTPEPTQIHCRLL